LGQFESRAGGPERGLIEELALPHGRGSERGAGGTSGRLHVEAYMLDVARLVEAHQALGEGFDLVF
jgi:hypothetical protein